MLKINYKGIIPQQREYSYSVKQNNKTNKVKFIVEKLQDDIDLSQYTPYLKLETPTKEYVDKIGTGLTVTSDTNFIYIVWNMSIKTTAYKNLNLQLQFQKAEGGTSTDVLVWQSAICSLELQNTIEADKEIAEQNPEKIVEIEAELENHEDRITALEDKGVEWGDIEGDIADQTDLVNLINTNIAPKANKTYVDAQDQALSDDIDDEQQARIDADNDLSDDIDAEETARQNADTALQEQINALSQKDRFLSGWNCMTGLPTSNPTTPLPYQYKTGDHYTVKFVDYIAQYEEYDTETAYLVGDKCKVTVGDVVTYYVCVENTQGAFDANAWQVRQASAIKNYRPTGTSYTGVASTVEETEPVAPNDVYQFDGAVWTLLYNTQKTVSMQNVTGLTEALAGKAGKAENNAFTGNNTHSGTETFNSESMQFENGTFKLNTSEYLWQIKRNNANWVNFADIAFVFARSLISNDDNLRDLGSTNKHWKEGFINKITDANGSYSSDNVFNVINANEIVNNTLTDAQYTTITNGKPTRIVGTILTFITNPLCLPAVEKTNEWNVKCLCPHYSTDANTLYLWQIIINKTTKVISFVGGYFKCQNLSLNELVLNNKAFPSYPTNPTSPKALIYDTDNTLKYQDVAVIPMTAPSSTTLTDAEYAELTNGKDHKIIGVLLDVDSPKIGTAKDKGAYYLCEFNGFSHTYSGYTFGLLHINKTTKIISIYNATTKIYDIQNIKSINNKEIPAYPANNEYKRLVCYGGTNAYVDDANVITDASSTTFSSAMVSGNLYKFSTPLTSFDPSGYTVNTNDLQPCWAVMFKVGATFTAPSTVTIKWRDDDAPSFESGKTYIISILQGIESGDYLGSYQEF